MRKSYNDKLKTMQERRKLPNTLLHNDIFEDIQCLNESSEAYSKLDKPEVYRYFIGAMEPVDPEITKLVYNQAEKVQAKLNCIKDDIEFSYKYQGSITNNTHIKAYSDIDILVIIDKYFTLEPPQIANNPYEGNPESDLMDLRRMCEKQLKVSFLNADIDCEGAKSIAISGKSFITKVDVVPANWYDTIKYTDSKNEIYRGIQVLDKYKMKRIMNTPFYHNYLLDMKDNKCSNNYKKVIRLLKTLKCDAEDEIKISSYDIVAILYHMNEDFFYVRGNDIKLLDNLVNFLCEIIKSEKFQKEAKVPDESRLIFNEPSKLGELRKLYEEVLYLNGQIKYS